VSSTGVSAQKTEKDIRCKNNLKYYKKEEQIEYRYWYPVLWPDLERSGFLFTYLSIIVLMGNISKGDWSRQTNIFKNGGRSNSLCCDFPASRLGPGFPKGLFDFYFPGFGSDHSFGSFRIGRRENSQVSNMAVSGL
jgi:hypothetical protein